MSAGHVAPKSMYYAVFAAGVLPGLRDGPTDEDLPSYSGSGATCRDMRII